jgi:glycosyltransferase involved in cell wall biosynthesis
VAQMILEPEGSTSHPPQVTIITHYYYPHPVGGAERQAQRIAETLAAQGWQMRVLTRHLKGTPKREMLNGVQVRRLWASEIPKTQFALLTLSFLYHLLAAPRGQVVHLNQMYREILPALIARRFRRSPIVVRLASGGAYGDVARLLKIPAGKLMLRLAHRADCIVSLSEQITQELLEQGFDGTRIVKIPNGVDIHHFVPASADERVRLRCELHLPPEGQVVIYTGRLHYKKGLDTLLRAWKEVCQDHPQAHLVLVGQGPEREKLEKLAASLDLGASLRFLGHKESVLPYLQASDVFVLPSFFEGLSNALLEAMACGLAVVTTNIGGTCEVVRPGIDGLLVEPGDAPALAASLSRVLGDATLAQQLGAEARRRVETHYAADAAIARYAAVYARLAGSPQKEFSPLEPELATMEKAQVE